MMISAFSRRGLWRSLALASLIWLGAELCEEPRGELAEASAAAPRRVAAYAYDRASLRFADADAKNLDQLNYSFALIKNGEVSGAHWKAIDRFKAYIAKYPHIQPVLSVGGWGAGGFSEAAATAEGRARFASSAVKLMEAHGFLGLDIDWEYPGSSVAGIAAGKSDIANFTLLLRELRAALDELTAADGKPRLLAIAVSGSPSQIKGLECGAIAGLVDQVNVMTYDLQTSGVASHHTPLYAADASYPLSVDGAVSACVAAGLPAGKLMVGAAFYGRVYQLAQSEGAPFASATGGTKTLTYKQIAADDGWTRRFDTAAQAAYATKGKQFLTYDSPESVRAKGAYAAKNGLMGLMCWEYGGDDTGELLAAMRQGLTP